ARPAWPGSRRGRARGPRKRSRPRPPRRRWWRTPRTSARLPVWSSWSTPGRVDHWARAGDGVVERIAFDALDAGNAANDGLPRRRQDRPRGAQAGVAAAAEAGAAGPGVETQRRRMPALTAQAAGQARPQAFADAARARLAVRRQLRGQRIPGQEVAVRQQVQAPAAAAVVVEHPQ